MINEFIAVTIANSHSMKDQILLSPSEFVQAVLIHASKLGVDGHKTLRVFSDMLDSKEYLDDLRDAIATELNAVPLEKARKRIAELEQQLAKQQPLPINTDPHGIWSVGGHPDLEQLPPQRHKFWCKDEKNIA